MRIEVLIYCYGAICVSMILFNCICIFAFKSSERRLNKRSRRFDRTLERQLEHIRQGEPVEEKHQLYLNKKLTRVGRLMAFDESLSKLTREDGVLAEQYLVQIRPVFIHLSMVYLKKETMQTAYFAYLLSKYKVCRQMPFDAILDVLKEYLKKDSLYCRQNTMKALYSFGCEEVVVEAVMLLDKRDVFYHDKILSDGLLTFEGDHQRLIALFWEAFDDFSVETKVTLLNYIRFKSGDYQERVLAILLDETQDNELHFAAIRYFGRYPSQTARPLLIRFVTDTDPLRWNYAAFAATALAGYPGSDTVEALKTALGNGNWYVRYNAALSLDALGVNYSQVVDIMNGNDRYAREMIMYRLESRKLKGHEAQERAVSRP